MLARTPSGLDYRETKRKVRGMRRKCNKLGIDPNVGLAILGRVLADRVKCSFLQSQEAGVLARREAINLLRTGIAHVAGSDLQPIGRQVAEELTEYATWLLNPSGAGPPVEAEKEFKELQACVEDASRADSHMEDDGEKLAALEEYREYVEWLLSASRADSSGENEEER